MNTSQTDFCNNLDSATLPSEADAVIVLRHITPEQTKARFDLGLSLLCKLNSRMIMMPYSSNTMNEAVDIRQICGAADYKTVVLVTHKYHSYRALLTFIKLGMRNTKFYIASVPSPPALIEFVKIMEYREKGDIADYEEGVQYLEWLSH